jgi:ABC-type phosphate/phosphonate transport system substrate-binding protein
MFKIGRTKYLQSITAAFWALPWLVINFLGQACAQGKVVIAIQPTVASDEMLYRAKPSQQFRERSLGANTTVEIYPPSSSAAVAESLRFGGGDVFYSRLKELNQWTPGFSTDALPC